jgi:hypothetical protein
MKKQEAGELVEIAGDAIYYSTSRLWDFNKIEHNLFAIRNRARKSVPLLQFFRKVHIDEFHSLYHLPDIFRTMKSRRM